MGIKSLACVYSFVFLSLLAICLLTSYSSNLSINANHTSIQFQQAQPPAGGGGQQQGGGSPPAGGGSQPAGGNPPSGNGSPSGNGPAANGGTTPPNGNGQQTGPSSPPKGNQTNNQNPTGSGSVSGKGPMPPMNSSQHPISGMNGSMMQAPIRLSINSSVNFPSGLPPIMNASAIGSLPPGMTRNISATIGVQLPMLGNSIMAAGLSARFGCLNCNMTSGAPPPQANGTIDGFIANGSISKLGFMHSSFGAPPNVIRNPGAAFAQNVTLRNQFVGNYTPMGFVPLPGVNFSMPMNGNGSAMASWIAQGNITRADVNISMLKMPPPNTMGIPLGQRVVLPYMSKFFNNTNVVNRSTMQDVYVHSMISGNRTVTRYIPTNITAYNSNQSTVVSITDAVAGFNNHVNIPHHGTPISNISLSLDTNFTASAIGMRYFGANASANITSKPLPPPPGRVSGYVSINCTISDQEVKGVNYTFNVTSAWLQSQHISPSNVSMYRFNTSTQTWTRLNTTLVSSNATTYVYDARSPGLSIYAISGNQSPSQSSNTSQSTTTIASTASSNTTKTSTTSSSSSGILLYAAIVVVILVIAAIAMLARNKKGTQQPAA